MKRYIVSIMSKDCAGIVAQATRAIYELGGDVADVKQTLLYEYFTMILAVQFDGDMSESTVVNALIAQSGEQHWAVSLRPVEGALEQSPEKQHDCYVVTVRCDNRKGVVNDVAEIFAAHNVNILDLETQLHDGLYVLAAQIDVAQSSAVISQMKAQLAALADEKNMSVTVQHDDIFRATNDIRL